MTIVSKVYFPLMRKLPLGNNCSIFCFLLEYLRICIHIGPFIGIKLLLSISANFSMQHSKVRWEFRKFIAICEVQKFISEFASQFVNKDCDWPLNSMKPIKFLIHKPACEFRNELLNFSQQTCELHNELRNVAVKKS